MTYFRDDYVCAQTLLLFHSFLRWSSRYFLHQFRFGGETIELRLDLATVQFRNMISSLLLLRGEWKRRYLISLPAMVGLFRCISALLRPSRLCRTEYHIIGKDDINDWTLWALEFLFQWKSLILGETYIVISGFIFWGLLNGILYQIDVVDTNCTIQRWRTFRCNSEDVLRFRHAELWWFVFLRMTVHLFFHTMTSSI
jgi:hypothetical protein